MRQRVIACLVALAAIQSPLPAIAQEFPDRTDAFLAQCDSSLTQMDDCIDVIADALFNAVEYDLGCVTYDTTDQARAEAPAILEWVRGHAADDPADWGTLVATAISERYPC